jgi:tRNA dimethylallyltransferase
MDIGTGKPTLADRQILPHHGIDCLEPGMTYSAHQFLDQAAAGFARAQCEDREVWVCGGTGLYIRALVEKLDLGGAPLPGLRAALGQRVSQLSARAVATALRLAVDDPDNPVRVIRAAELACQDAERAARIYDWAGLPTELVERDGRGSNDLREARQSGLERWHCVGIAVLDPSREELAKLIRARVEWMFEHGLVNEVTRLRELGYGKTPVVCDGIGYREAGHVLNGELGLEDAISRTLVRTQQYAKRQRTYFRGRGWPVMSEPQLAKWAASMAQFSDSG